jgi:seryl-tRNA synthetase
MVQLQIMLDIKFIRENQDIIKEAARKKHIPFKVEDLVKVDTDRLEILRVVEELRSKQNATSEKITKVDATERQTLIEEMKGVKDSLKKTRR